MRKGTRLLLDEREGWTKDRLAVDTAQMGLAFLQGNTWYIPLEKVSTDRGQTASYSSWSFVVAIALLDISPKRYHDNQAKNTVGLCLPGVGHTTLNKVLFF